MVATVIYGGASQGMGGNFIYFMDSYTNHIATIH